MNDLNSTNLTDIQQAQNEAVKKAFSSQNIQAAPIAPQATIKPIALDNLDIPKINVPPASPVATTPLAPNPNLAQSVLDQTKVQDTEAQKQSQNLSTLIYNLAPELQGQSQALAEAQRAVGVQDLTKNLNEINSQILIKQAEIGQDDVRLAQSLQSIEDKPIAMDFITGQQASVQRNAQLARALKNSEIGILNARAIGLQGNIQLAKDTAQQAVDLKYAPQKELLATYQAQLEALKPTLAADEKKQAREQELRTNLALKDLEKKQADDNAIQATIVDAISAGAPKNLLDQASKAKTPLQAAMILGQYSKAALQTQLLKSQIETERAQKANYNANAAKTNKETALLGGTGTGQTLSGEDLSKFNALPQVKSAQNAVPFRQALADYKTAIETYGTGEVMGKGSGALNEAYQRLSGAIKDYYNLGSLDNGVQKLISIGIPEPSIFGMSSSRTTALENAISAIDKDVENKFKQIDSTKYAGTQEYKTIKDQYIQEKTRTANANNPFQQALGQSNTVISGTSVVNKINNDGSIDFAVPTTVK